MLLLVNVNTIHRMEWAVPEVLEMGIKCNKTLGRLPCGLEYHWSLYSRVWRHIASQQACTGHDASTTCSQAYNCLLDAHISSRV